MLKQIWQTIYLIFLVCLLALIVYSDVRMIIHWKRITSDVLGWNLFNSIMISLLWLEWLGKRNK